MAADMDMGGMQMAPTPAAKPAMKPNPSDFTANPVHHANGIHHVDMRADAPQYRLDDPGVGLRNNGRRVLTYADLKNLRTTHDHRDPTEIELHLTGNIRYKRSSLTPVPAPW
ncbi:hypothetical protein [endosymbiont of Lamellibrachia barhami]|uniref:hypothetical protein n=1 Tax=endosymbiont of Lamellibrachia barhami TaxID=205975 RepID=UPI0015AB4058|nr:hypothetical protein [endosymbiont of Lamellibrachia barhami]